MLLQRDDLIGFREGIGYSLKDLSICCMYAYIYQWHNFMHILEIFPTTLGFHQNFENLGLKKKSKNFEVKKDEDV